MSDFRNYHALSDKSACAKGLVASLPVLVGYLVMGIAWGIVAHSNGYDLATVMFASALIFSGSLQFLMISMLQAGLGLSEIVLAATLLNSRYCFYVIGAKDQLDAMPKWQRFISYFTINDESFAIISANKFAPKAVFYLLLFCYLYWLIGCFIGKSLATVIKGDYTSLSFSSKALFIVLAYELITKCKNRYALALSLVASVCAWLFVPEQYMLLCAVLGSLIVLLVFKELKLV